MSAPVADIPLAELAKLLKILGMLGSAYEGERANAALLAHKWVEAHATSWAVLLTPPELPNPVVSVGVAGDDDDAAAPQPHHFNAAASATATHPPSGVQVSWKAAAQAVLTWYPNCLRGAKEEDFVKGLLAKGWPKLTDKQSDWLRDICARAGLSW